MASCACEGASSAIFGVSPSGSLHPTSASEADKSHVPTEIARITLATVSLRRSANRG